MIVYTCITNDYDNLKEPRVITPGWEYICYSDAQQKSDVWETIITDRPQREVKILGNDYNERVLYVDGSIQIIGDLDKFLMAIGKTFSLWRHPVRDCIFQEAEAVIEIKGLNKEVVYRQMLKYNDMPRHWGLGQTGVLYRDFGDEDVQRLSIRWWNEVRDGVTRDQLSLTWCAWKLGMRPHFVPESIIDRYFLLYPHNTSVWGQL